MHQRGLLHRQRYGGYDALTRLHAIFSTFEHIFRLNLPQNRLIAGQRQLRRCSHQPSHFTRFASGDVHRLRLQVQQGGAGRHIHLHGLFGGVAQGDLRFELIVFPHQRRQAADDLQVLRGFDHGRTRAKQARGRIGHGDDFETGKCIVQGHGHHRLAIGIELDAGVPQQQGVKQLPRATASAAAASRHGFATIVTPADDFHLRGRCFYAPAAALQHGLQQVPAGVGTEF